MNEIEIETETETETETEIGCWLINATINSYNCISTKWQPPQQMQSNRMKYSTRRSCCSFEQQQQEVERKMKPYPLFPLLLLLSSSSLNQYSSLSTITNNDSDRDRLALLQFKESITGDPFRVMSSWNDSIHFCKWAGVSCTPSNQNQRVMILNLENQQLVGILPPSIGNLTSLIGIDLRKNNLHGQIPQQIGRLSKLQFLKLTSNSFTGEIPSNLSNCSQLQVLDLVHNDFIGYIPNQLTSLTNLLYLGLGANNLTGIIPHSIGNLSSLTAIALAQNHLEGEIPEGFGRLSKLGFFQLYDNKLSGTIPSSIYNISSLFFFMVTQNQLHGSLPPDIGITLPNLKFLFGGVNNFTGPIPVSISNISRLKMLGFENNHLTGPLLPMGDFGRLKSLTRLNFGSNQISSSGTSGDLNLLLTSLANCTRLELLVLENNLLGGELPKEGSSIANLSTHLSILKLGGNGIRGVIPEGIGNLVNLTVLGLEGNHFTGGIPFVIGKLHKLGILDLNSNRFSGKIPSSIGNLTQLNSLYMGNNGFEGSIPPTLGNCRNLVVLNLSYNNLNGTIPKQVFNISSLSIALAVDHNSLTGSLPLEVGNLKALEELKLSENKFSGEIPSALANCISLERLYMGGNFFQGDIPESLSSLRGLQVLDLSGNNLSGKIPNYLEKLSSLKYLNLSFNDFDGEVPKQGIFADLQRISVVGNKKLCGGIRKLRLPVCSSKQNHKWSNSLHLSLEILIGFGFLFVFLLSLLATCYWIRQLRKRTGTAASASEDLTLVGVSYAHLFHSTGGFSLDNLIGEGSFSSVYKAVLYENEPIVAVKVFKMEQVGASKSFVAECQALRNIRHRNLVNILTVCSSLDSGGNEFKALVFELMSNGNLDEWLHPQVSKKHPFTSLNLSQRLNIAIDVASALEYLHHDCEIPIVHCDLKPSNVLLDDDMMAHVADFGLARFLFETTNNSFTNQSVGLKGSIGYIPPEYGMGGQVSIFGDIYSYGILLLEMFTGKRPTGEMFKEGMSLRSFAMTGSPDRVKEIVDPVLLLSVAKEVLQEKEAIVEVENSSISSIGNKMFECLVCVIQIGVSCSMPSPSDRMTMREVVSKMHGIRNSFLEFSSKRIMDKIIATLPDDDDDDDD